MVGETPQESDLQPVTRSRRGATPAPALLTLWAPATREGPSLHFEAQSCRVGVSFGSIFNVNYQPVGQKEEEEIFPEAQGRGLDAWFQHP